MYHNSVPLFFAICLFIYSNSVYADINDQFSPVQGSYTSDGIETTYAVTANFGTHIVGVGVNSAFNYATAIKTADLDLGFIETGAFLGFKHYTRYLGIPGASDMATAGLTVTYGLGPENHFPSNPYNHAGPARHNFSYRSTWYLSTDGTNQSTGRVAYELAGDRNKFKFQMDNDLYKLPIRDEYRTAAGEIEYLHAFRRSVGGFSLGFMLWTGTTDGLEPVPGTRSFDLTGQYGGEYSNGIVFVSLIWGIGRLSIGYDSEGIRALIQNTAHKIGNYYLLPELDRASRWYFQFSLATLDSLYQ